MNRLYNSILKVLKSKYVLRFSLISALSFSLSGCLLTSPFWGQTYDARSETVTLQSYTIETGTPVVYQCSKAYHGGLYPFTGNTWITIASVYPSTHAMYDSNGIEAYTASKSLVLPSDCWHYDNANNKYTSAIRANISGNSSAFSVFDESGLACLGEEIGAAGSWVAWINAGCALTYSNSSTKIPYVKIFADS